MPQLDFTMWLLNLSMKWLMFLLLFLSLNISKKNGGKNMKSSMSHPKMFKKTKWTWKF